MVAQATCPETDVIRDLLCGDLPDHEHEDLASHFDDCSVCQQHFEDEAAGIEFLGDVARLCSNPVHQESATIERLLRDIPQELSHAADAASVATWSADAVADFLEPSDEPDHIGRLGSYEVIEVIGRGGMGIVLRGIDTKLNRVVAIKVLAPELASNPNARRRFYREGQAAAAVSHDHVVTIHAVDDHGRLPYLVMEFIAGESLEECVARAGSMSVESILRIGRQTALGLSAAHEVGLVHRDMKPANILLENGIKRVRITDFGLARAADDVAITRSGVVSGTPLYMSPEQASGENIDYRSDLFSLGSVLYTLCTGRPAFRAQTTVGVLKRVCDDTPRPIREINSDIPDWLVEIIDRLISKRPDDRLQSAAEVAEVLGGHLAHLQDPVNVPAPASVAITSDEDKSPSRLRRLPLLVALLVAVTTLGVTEAAGVTQFAEWLGIVLKLKTPEGTLVVDIQDPNVKVSVDGNEVVIDGIGKQELRLKPGKYQWKAKRNGTVESTDWVTIERNGKTIVRIKQLPPDNVSKPAKPGDSAGTQAKNTPGLPTPYLGQLKYIDQLEATDGVTFYSTFRQSRFNGALITTPIGRFKFKNIPEQLWGQNYAVSPQVSGKLDCRIMPLADDKNSDTRRKSEDKQRVWLLMALPKTAEGKAPENVDSATLESLTSKGWQGWRSIESDRQQATPEVLKWSVFYRDVEPGDRVSVRTHGVHVPMLVWGSLDLNGINIKPQWDQRVSRFIEGASVSLGNGYHVFDEVPEFLEGRLYANRNGYQGITRFTVKRAQKVVVGFFDWKHMNDGNNSGGWRPELTSPTMLKNQGWVQIATLSARHSNASLEGATWSFYSRNCKAGESFALRNHKYQAPIVFSDSGVENPPQNEPNQTSASNDLPESKDLLKLNQVTAPGTDKPFLDSISLDKSRVTAVLAPPIDKPTVYGIHSLKSPSQDHKALFHQCACGNLRVGSVYLIGQIVGDFGSDAKINVERFERTGSRLRLVLRQAVTNNKPKLSQADQRAQRAVAASDAKITESYETFLRVNASHKDVGRTLLEFARHEMYLASKAEKPEADQLLQRARERIETARKLLNNDLAAEDARLKAFPDSIDKETATKQVAQRNAAQQRYSSAQIQLAICHYLEAHTHARSSADRNKKLIKAGNEFEQLFASHRSSLAGLYARAWHGLCVQESGNYVTSKEILADVTRYPSLSSVSIQEIKNQALHYSLIGINDHEKKWDQVIKQGTAWFTNASTFERKTDAGAGIVWEISRAMEAVTFEGEAGKLAKNASPPMTLGTNERNRLLRRALKLFRRVKSTSGKYADIAKMWEQDVVALLGDDVAAKLIRPPSPSVYFQVRLPSLPPGDYTIEASIGQNSGDQSALVRGSFSVDTTNAIATQLKLLVIKALMIKPASITEFPGPQTQTSMGLDLSQLLKLSGEDADAKAFPSDNSKFAGRCDLLRLEGKRWALSAMLDHKNVDAKILAARALGKLGDADTVAVLLAAAKRNNYGVNGSESATLHSIYRSSLKKSLEAITNLNLTPGLQTNPDKKAERSESPDVFTAELAFDRVENWLRTVYLAQTNENIKVLSPIHKSEPGLVGRAKLNGKDPGFIFHYPHGRFFANKHIPVSFHDSRGFEVSLEGYVVVPKDMIVRVWQVGGGVSHDQNWLYIDDKQMGVTGDNHEKELKLDLPMTKGLHRVRWLLTGGTFRTNILVFIDPHTGKLMDLVSKGIPKTREQIIRIDGTEIGWPIQEKSLPPAVQELRRTPIKAVESKKPVR
jgi:serine/threonine protein kinase